MRLLLNLNQVRVFFMPRIGQTSANEYKATAISPWILWDATL